MPRNRFVKKVELLFALFGLLFGLRGMAQPDCRSVLGSHIKPLGSMPLSWGVELTGAGAVMNDRTIANWSAYAGLDFSLSKHQVYFEGAYKNWYNSAKNPDGEEPRTGLPDYNRPAPLNWGFRELFYRFGSHEQFIKAGIQSFKSKDHFLFDERMLGLSTAIPIGNVAVQASVGTVAQIIARFQDICGNRHIYNILHRSQYNFVGKRPGETNFGAVFLNWKPGTSQKAKASSNDGFKVFDEFDDPSFSQDASEAAKNKKSFKFDDTGIFFYEEFGKGFHEYKYYSGLHTTLSLPFQFTFKAEAVDQYILNDHALAFWLGLEKVAVWRSGNISKWAFSYLAKIDIDENAHFYPAFSNLFLGEVMRLDAIDLPLAAGSFKHQLAGKWKPYLQINGVQQLKGNRSGEVDLLLGIRPMKNLRLTGIFSYLGSEVLDINYQMAKLEIRYAF